MTLSMKFSSPSTTFASPSCAVAVTGTLMRPMFCLMAPRLADGTEKVTKIGSTCAIVVSSVWFAAARPPTLMAMLPLWPSIGERIEV